MKGSCSELPPRRVSVAPMMNRTDRHFRFLARLITRHAWLYTEMLVARALVHGRGEHLFAHDAAERPLALQLGGSEPAILAQAARAAEERGYDEVNLNVGCPSARVTRGRMGACLMREPALAAECIAAMRAATTIPVTVKTRIGVDHDTGFEFLCRFVEAVAAAGCRTVIVHARKAWLDGVSPKANRTVPPLDYERVYALKAHLPQLEIVVNGGIGDLDAAAAALERVDGVMLGRAAYARPLMLVDVDRKFYGDAHPMPSLGEILTGYLDYLAGHGVENGIPAPALGHLAGLFTGLPGARAIRSRLGGLAGGRSLVAVERTLTPYMRARAA